jgi:hypothetical protein
MVFRAEKSHVTPFFLCLALSRSPFGPKNDHRRARCAVRQQSPNVTPTHINQRVQQYEQDNQKQLAS